MNKRLRILIADDNVELCEIIKHYLEESMDVDILGTVYDGEEELRLIRILKPDIIITDLQRKRGISGIDVIRKCYNDFELKKIKFIIETASYSKEELDILIELGIEHFLMKPFHLHQLIEKIIYEGAKNTANNNTIIEGYVKGEIICKKEFYSAMKQR